jgi:lipopolysaccharide transport system ATP-binding protein
MNTATMIDFRGVCKRFHRRITVRAVLTEMLGLSGGADSFWALEDVGFEVGRGECLGIIGPNGAGKTTILKILAGVTGATRGSARLAGRVGSLIDVRAGFHPELTGRENVHLGGAIYGMSRREIREKFDRIVEFSELGDAIDMPVKRYSSGMLVRLGFSVAAHVEPEILLVDEVLSVGDAAFRVKCYRRARELRDRAGAVVFVSHDMLAIRNFCDRVLWLDSGEVREVGGPAEVVAHYLAEAGGAAGRTQFREAGSFATGPGDPLRFTGAELLDAAGSGRAEFRPGERVRLRLHYEAEREIEEPRFNVSVSGGDGPPLITASQVVEGQGPKSLAAGKGTVDCVFESLPLMPGRYQFCGCAYGDGGNVTMTPWQSFVIFTVRGEEGIAAPAPERARGQMRPVGPVDIAHHWEFARS